MTFQELLEESNFETRKYSGRGMHGKECLGVQAERLHATLLDIGAICGTAGMNVPNGTRVDELGLDWIIYWPNIKFEE